MRLTTLIATVVLAATAAGAFAAEWPHWLGPDRNGTAPDTGINKDWNARAPRELWRTALHDNGHAGPSVADGKVFIVDHEGSEDVVRAIDLATGQDLWQTRYADLAKWDYGFTRSTPVYDEGRIYVVSYLGRVTCLDAGNGAILWSLSLPEQFGGVRPRWGYAMSVLIDGERAVVVPGGVDAAVAVLDKQTGEAIWAGGGSDFPGYSTPVRATIQDVEQYVVFMGKALIGVAVEDGRLLWRHPWETAYDVNAATPIISGNNVFITSNYKRGCAVIAIEPTGPRVVWENTNIDAHVSTPVYLNGLIFGSDNKNLVCLNPGSGQILWSAPGLEKGGAVGVDGTIIALGGATGTLMMLEAAAEMRELGRFTPLGGKDSWTAPIITDGKLLVRNGEALVCLDIM